MRRAFAAGPLDEAEVQKGQPRTAAGEMLLVRSPTSIRPLERTPKRERLADSIVHLLHLYRK